MARLADQTGPRRLALIVGGQGRMVRDLRSLLSGHALAVETWSQTRPFRPGRETDEVKLLILAGSGRDLNDPALVRALRDFFPRAKIICLGRIIDRQTEAALRAQGLVFLGSFQRFKTHTAEILGSACKPR